MAVQISGESMSFGTLLRRFRVEAGLSQEVLAERAHMSARGISDLERDVRRTPYRETISQLAIALDLDDPGRAALEQAARRVRETASRKDQPPHAASPGTPSAGNELLATKLIAPPPRPALVPRPRLLQQLNAGLTCPVTLISAPAGSGKTTLLGAWRAVLPAEVSLAWVSLDAGDNDPARFWRYVLCALETVAPGVSREALRLLESSQPAAVEAMLTALVNALIAVPGDTLLVLDDYYVITAQSVHEGIAFLLRHLPPRVQLVISTRSDPPLPLALLRGRGLITELRAADLRFTREEATTFLTEVMGLPLKADEIGVLEMRTEGWIAGLQLAGLSLQGRSPEAMEQVIASFTGSHRYVVDYLADEVLARLPAQVQAFLLNTSILDRMCASLCGYLMEACPSVIDGEGTASAVLVSQEVLEKLEHDNLFVVGLDDHREWYRYHHLFADAMRHGLQRQHPDLIPKLHERASAWFEEHGLLHEAIRHALQAEAFEHAADLIEQMVPVLHAYGARLTAETWLAALPETIVQSRPGLSIARAQLALHDGAVDAAEHLLQVTEQALQEYPEGHPPERSPAATLQAGERRNIEGEINASRAVAAMIRRDPRQAMARAREALARLNQDNASTRGGVARTLGQAYVAEGDLVRARRAYDEARTTFRSLENPYLGVRVMLYQSYVERALGCSSQAAETCREALRWSAGHLFPDVGLIHMQLADLLRESNDLEGAILHATEGMTLSASLKHPDLRVFPDLVLARVRQAQGDLSGALDVLRRAKERAHDPAMEGYRSLLETYEAQIKLMEGDVATAAQLAQKAARETDASWLQIHPFFVYAYEHVTIAPIQLLVARGRVSGDSAPLDTALELLEQQCGHAERAGLVWYRIKLLALQALAHHALDDKAPAFAAIEQALTLAQPKGYVRLFADEGQPMAELLRRVDAPEIAADYLQLLASSASPSSTDHRLDLLPGTLRAS
ncbi:MAG TPA: helix-turn-helix domain-containing protein [Chloroflexota bacterium]